MIHATRKLALLAGLILALGAPLLAHADDWWPHSRDDVVVASPAPYRGPPPAGLSVVLTDRDFSDRWNHSDVQTRAQFCHTVRHDCEVDGRRSRACALKWQYCTPQGRDYGYYPNR